MKKLVENSVHENSAVSSADCILLETLIDQATKRSHRAVREAEIIPVDEGSSLFQYMNQIYQGVMNFILFEGDTRFCEKTKRGYVGYKTVASCPGHVAENPELNYSKKKMQKGRGASANCC